MKKTALAILAILPLICAHAQNDKVSFLFTYFTGNSQVCIDPLTFDKNGLIIPVTPSR